MSDETPPSPLSQNLNAVLNSAPELGNSPGLSVGLATAGGDVSGNAQAVARGAKSISATKGFNSVAGSVGGGGALTDALNWFGNHVSSTVGQVGSDVLKGAEDVGGAAMSTLNKPLQIVQHEYRYLHDVEATHGADAALLEGLFIAVGTAGGAALAGPWGGVLGAELTTGAEGQLMYHDSWERTGSPSYVDPHTHQQVSIGRDIISELTHLGVPGLERPSTAFKVTSGLIDGIFDMNVGGTEALGIAGEANSAEGASGVLGSYFPGKGPQTAEDFDNLMNNPISSRNVKRAFSDIASKSGPEIADKYRTFADHGDFLKKLADANTQDDVAEVFRSAIRAHELAYMEKLPTISATRLPFQAAHEWMGNSEIPGVQKLFKSTSRMPTSYDEVKELWTNKDFDPGTADGGVLGIYRTLLSTESQNTASSVAQAYLDADVPGRLRIWRNIQLSTLMNLSGYRDFSLDEYLDHAFDDPIAREQWRDSINHYITESMFGKGAKYGVGPDGADISIVRDMESGTEFGAGITKNQIHGRLQYLDLPKMRQAGRILGDKEIAAKIGGFGDFFYDNITSRVFKKWALASPSYAFHIALAELIPNTLRLGLTNIAKAAVTSRAADAALDVEDGEEHAVAGVVYKLARALHVTNDQDLRYLTDHIVYNDGDRIHPSLTSAHNISDEVSPEDQQASRALRRLFGDSGAKPKLGDDFDLIGPTDRRGLDAWQSNLWESSRDEASRLAANMIREGARRGLSLDEATDVANRAVAAYLRGEPEEYEGFAVRSLDQMTAYSKEVPRPAELDSYDEWGQAVVKKVLGETTGKDGTLHIPLLNHVANDELVDDDELSDIPTEKRPVNVRGREIIPQPSTQQAALRWISTRPDWMFRRWLNPMVNMLSREPIGAAEYLKQRYLLQSMVDKGLMTDDEAMVAAEERASKRAIDNIHNLTDRTQWTETFRNFAPFYFAQEQAYRRLGRLLAEDPAAFRKYQLMISSMHNVGQVFAGQDGEGYFVVPGTGFMTAGVTNALHFLHIPVEAATPVGIGWNLSSSSVIFPLSAGFRPDVGPLLSIPVALVSQLFPESLSPILKSDMTAVATTVLGPAATEAWYDQMIPNTIIQRALVSLAPGFDARSFDSTFMQTLATLDFEGKLPPADANYRTMQTFLDRVRNQTRIMYLVKALVGGVTPVSPELQDTVYQQFTSELSADIAAKKSVAAGLQDFLSKHPDATPFTTWQSQGLTGTDVPASVQAENWINNNMDLINKYPNAGILLMPTNTSTTHNQAVYNEQIAQSLRAKLDPEQWTQDGAVPSYFDALYIAGGNSVFYKWYSQFEQQIKHLSGSEKYDAEQAFWGNGQAGNTAANGTIGNFGAQNPVWYNWFQSDTRKTQRGETIRQMQQLLKDNPQIKTPQADDIRNLLTGYQNYENQINLLTKDHLSSTLVSEATDSWNSFLQGAVRKNPGLTNAVTAMFMSVTDEKAPQVNITNTPGVFHAKGWNKVA